MIVQGLSNNLAVNLDTFTFGFHFPIGNGRIMMVGNHTNDKRINNSDVTSYSLGYDYMFSKRTDIYSSISGAQNSNNAQYALGGGGYAGGFTSDHGVSAKVLQLGLRHKF